MANSHAYRMMVTNSSHPNSKHAPERDKNAKKIRHQEHGLSANLEVSLKIPKANRRRDRATCLHDSQVSNLKEGEGDGIILDDWN